MTADTLNLVQKVLRYILALVVCLTILALFIPLDPSMPAPGLDTSWMYAMNQAVARGLVFGRDIVFSFGPYASIYTGLYDPATDRMMVWGSLFLGLSYAFALILLGEGKKFYGLLPFGIFLAGFMYSRDALLFSYPLILALVVYRITLPDHHEMKLIPAKPIDYVSILLFSPLGLLPLIKGNLVPICGLIAVLCCGLYWRYGRKLQASLVVIVPALSCVLFWVASGQPVSALPGFFLSMRPTIAGYTEAMSFPGDLRECILYVFASAIILLVVAWTARGPRSYKWFLCMVYVLFLFTGFKSAFVRHDQWHNMNAGASILAAALLLIFVLREVSVLVPLAMAVLVWTYIDQRTTQVPASYAPTSLQSTLERAIQGARIRWTEEGELKTEYEEHLATIRKEYPIPPMAGTTDIYSFNQSWLLASGNTWAPRPVVQSYTAYTPELAEMDLRHLQGASAPDNILFRVEPIDGRLPSLEDGLSWPALINGYSLRKLEGQSAYLRKKAAGNADDPPADDFSVAKHGLGEQISLPDADAPLFARIEISPTLPGRILGVLYKPPELYISMRLRDGTQMKYRVESKMMKTDFLITPLVKNTEEFVLLAAGGNKYLAGEQVKSMVISSAYGNGLFWKSDYSMTLRKIHLSQNTDSENSFLFDKMSDVLPKSLSDPATLVCEGAIERVNGKLTRFGIATVTNVLSVEGWMTVAAKDGIVPDSVFVTLTNESGKAIYVKARSTPREDIKRHWQQPELPDPGYAAMIDVSALSGRYTLGLARAYKGKLGICQQFKLPFLIAR